MRSFIQEIKKSWPRVWSCRAFEVVSWGRDKLGWLIVIWPIGSAELPPGGRVLSGPCPLDTSTTYPGSRPSKLTHAYNACAQAHTYTPTYTHTLYPLGAKLQRWSGPCMPSRVWCDGEGRKQGGVRDVKIVFNQSQSLVQLMEKVTALLIPSPGTITVILSHSVFYIYITQHTRCKEYNLLTLHLAVQILGFRRLLQTPQSAYCKWTVGGHFSKYC